MSKPPNARRFVERLFAEHGRSLQGFFYRRIRAKADASDLAQEVFLRMLRVPDPGAILRPDLYLFTVASNLLKEYAVLEGRRARQVDADAPEVQPELESKVEFDGDLDRRCQTERLLTVVRQLSPKCQAALVLQFREHLSYQEIATRLGISSHMVKKYLAQGLAHCRRRMAHYG